MFTKAQKTSKSTLLKNKDVKKLRRDIASYFQTTEDQIAKLFTSKTVIRKLDCQAPSRMVIYVSEEFNEPLLFDISGKGDYCFSVYALWKVPDLVPKLIIHAPVSEFILRGADLMLPGVRFEQSDVNSNAFALKKGELRAVYVYNNPMPFAIGEILRDVDSSEISGSERPTGKILSVWHRVLDELWRMGPQSVPNDGYLLNPMSSSEKPRIVGINVGGKNDKEAMIGDDNIYTGNSLPESSNDGDINTFEQLDINDEISDSVEEKHFMDEKMESEENQEGIGMTREEMDVALKQALLQALKTNCISKGQLPMLASKFYAQIILPNRLAGVSLNVKFSSYKKTVVFLESMAAEGILTIATYSNTKASTSSSNAKLKAKAKQAAEANHVQEITSVWKQHPDVRAHIAYKTAGEEEGEMQSKDNQTTTKRNPPRIDTFLGLTPQLNQLFKQVLPIPTKKYYSASEIGEFINQYIEDECLVIPEMKQFMQMNGPLLDILFPHTGKQKDRTKKLLEAYGGQYPTTMPRSDAIKKIIELCPTYYRIVLDPSQEHLAQIKGGSPPKIQIHAALQKKRKNCTITTLSYFEPFGIIGQEVASIAQKKFGCSCTVEDSVVILQGNLTTELLKFLEEKYLINSKKLCEVTFGKNVKAKK